MKRSFLLVGNIKGAYRSQLLINKLIEYRAENNFVVTFISNNYLSNDSSNIFKKIFFPLLKILQFVFLFFELNIKIPFCDTIYILPMNHFWFLPVYIVNLIWRKPIISDLYISLYDTGLDRKKYISRSKFKTFYYKITRAFYHKTIDKLIIEKSTRVIHLNEFEFNYIVDLVGAKKSKIQKEIVPLCVKEKRRAKPIYSSKFRVAWWGTWIPLHGIDNILNAFTLLKNKNIQLSLYGIPGNEVNYVKSLIAERKLNNIVSIYTNASFGNGLLEAAITSNCDLSLGIFGNTVKAQNVIVNKIIDAFAMELPILTMKTEALDEFIDIDNELFVCSNDPQNISKAILYIKENQTEAKRRALMGYKKYCNVFSPEKYWERLSKIFDDLVAQG